MKNIRSIRSIFVETGIPVCSLDNTEEQQKVHLNLAVGAFSKLTRLPLQEKLIGYNKIIFPLRL